MTISYARAFLVIGSLYLLAGIGFGMVMGGTGDFSLAPVHAHINLVGFVLMTLFGLLLRTIPGMAGTLLATAHFWLFQIGALGMVVSLYLMLSGTASPAAVGPVIMLSEILVLAGVLAFVANLYRNA